jgi:hypothetical protein
MRDTAYCDACDDLRYFDLIRRGSAANAEVLQARTYGGEPWFVKFDGCNDRALLVVGSWK